MSENNRNFTISMSWPMVIFTVLMTLKLCKVIDWSWWWVTSPIWLTVGLALVVVLIVIILRIIAELCS